MPLREELVNSAVSFLQDPSVAGAPLDNRIAFLESKNLTQEEINAALQRAAEVAGTAPPPAQAPYGQHQPAGYGQYPGGYWQQPPPEIPKRDWRDWFIMATLMGGVGYGLYFTAKRYVLPLIQPPTPPQLTQDKEAIDTSFTKAFNALEQLETDTKALKEAEESRTSRLDSSLTELESVISALKDSDRKREEDARRNADEIRSLRDLIPKALEAQKSVTESRVKDLTAELKSLRTLMSNRMGSGPVAGGSGHRSTPSAGTNGTPAATPAPPAASSTITNGNHALEPVAPQVESSSAPAPIKSPTPSSSPFPRFGSGKAAIPAWQMAAAKKEDPAESSTPVAEQTSTAA